MLTGGQAATTPVAVIQSATGKAQAQLITTLAALPQDLALSGIVSTASIGIGDVARRATATVVNEVCATATLRVKMSA